MESVQRIHRTDLARHAQRVLAAVQKGETALIESRGKVEAAIVDIVDYRIMRAVVRYFTQETATRPQQDAGLTNEEFAAAADAQAGYDLVVAHYLAQSISLGRAAELLGQSWWELRSRFRRLEVPINMGPASLAELEEDVKNARDWTRQAQP